MIGNMLILLLVWGFECKRGWYEVKGWGYTDAKKTENIVYISEILDVSITTFLNLYSDIFVNAPQICLQIFLYYNLDKENIVKILVVLVIH